MADKSVHPPSTNISPGQGCSFFKDNQRLFMDTLALKTVEQDLQTSVRSPKEKLKFSVAFLLPKSNSKGSLY